jgi:hypothetical protein
VARRYGAIAKAGMNGQVTEITTRREKAPRVMTVCVAAGTKKSIACPR